MCRSVVCRCKSVKSVCRRRAAAPALFLKSLGYFRDPNGKTNQQSLQWVPSISSIMTPCRTEKVDFSKKIKKTESPKNKIDRKNHQKKQKKQEKTKPAFSAVFVFFICVCFILVFLFLSCFFLGFGFLVCFFVCSGFVFFLCFYVFCQTLYSLCCWTHNSG